MRVPTLDATHPFGVWAALIADLDRCPHGRHQADPCFGCEGGWSRGNPLLCPGQVIGYSIDGSQIVVPPKESRRDPAAWRCRPELEQW
jgi:hypothetical protein